jgi:tetratricopeptide (TPR) repeat protein
MKFRSALLFLVLALAAVGRAQDAARLVAQGDSLLAIGRAQKAADRYTAAIALAPTAPNYAARARAWMNMDRMDRMLLDCEKALKADSLNPEACLLRAIYAFRSEDHRTAERMATRALEHGAKAGQRGQALLIRGQARTELKDHNGAVGDLREGLGNRTEDRDAMRSLARALDALGDHAGSLAVLEQLCAVQPDDIGNWTNRGYELAALGRYDEALTIYGEALALDKDEPTVLSNRAWTLWKLGRNDEALKDVDRSLKSYPANPYALRTRALLLLAKGHRERACNDLQLARIIGGVPEVNALIDAHCAGMPPKR